MYVRSHDYDLYCDQQTLTQIVNKDLSLRRLCEYAAEDQIRSYLVQRYDFSPQYGEFTDTTIYSNTTTYKARNRVYLDGPLFIGGSTYSVNVLVLWTDGNIYIKNANVSGYTNQNPTNTAYWDLLGVQYDLFFITFPQNPWRFDLQYEIGQQIWYKDKVYTAQLLSKNVAPDSTFGANYWGTGTPYSVPAGTYPTNTAYWNSGDNRNNYLLQIYICIVIYNMMYKIAPRNIPQPRIDSYKDSVDWLKNAGAGMVTAELPLLTPEQGSSIRWGSVQKKDNIY